jgi:hypothetical protein
MFEVIAGVPIPGRKCEAKYGSLRYPFKAMKVGDSFLVPVEEEGKHKLQRLLSSAARNFGKPKGLKYVTRQLDEGVRVWRVL